MASSIDRTSDKTYGDEEIERRMNEAVKRALNTPPKPKKAGMGENLPSRTGTEASSKKTKSGRS